MSRATHEQKRKRCKYFEYGTITVYGDPFQNLPLYLHLITLPTQVQHFCRTTPNAEALGLGCFRFARRY